MMDHWHHNYDGGEIKEVVLPQHRLKAASYLLSDDVQTYKKLIYITGLHNLKYLRGE